MDIGRNKTSITNHNHLSPAPWPVDAEAVGLIDAQERKDGPRVDKNPDFGGKNRGSWASHTPGAGYKGILQEAYHVLFTRHP
jgi:hypothetical protein